MLPLEIAQLQEDLPMLPWDDDRGLTLRRARRAVLSQEQQ